MHNFLACIKFRAPHQAFLGRRPHPFPLLEGGCYGELDVKGQDNSAKVREIAAVTITEATAKQRLQRSAKRNQVVAQERAEHLFGDLVDIWYDPPSKDTPLWRGPVQIANVNVSAGGLPIRFQGGTLDRCHQEVRANVLDLVY